MKKEEVSLLVDNQESEEDKSLITKEKKHQVKRI
jgi:hypothetical protein